MGVTGLMNNPDLPVTLTDVEAAEERIRDVVHRTPLDPSETFADLSGADAVHLKLENMQKTGAFKPRGAYNCLSRLPQEATKHGVVTISAGNHAQGVAYAARELDIPAWVVMPEGTPAVKVAATRGYGGTVELHGTVYDEFYGRAIELADEHDLTFVHPFDDPDVMAGQGTVGLELVEEVPDTDTVFVAVGGGGLISGVAAAVKGKSSDARIVGVETEGSAHAQKSLDVGAVEPRTDLDTIAEGISAGRLGEQTIQMVEEFVDEVVTVSDEQVTEAMALLAERAKQVAEAAGAVPVAGLLSGHVDVEDEIVACIVSGGNLDLTEHGTWTKRGLIERNRYAHFRVALAGWPTALTTLVEAVENADGELDDLRHEPPGDDVPPNRRAVTIGVGVTGSAHRGGVAAAIDERPELDLL